MQKRAAFVLAVSLAGSVLAWSPLAAAHIRLDAPNPRSTSDALKSGPCGGVASNGSFTQYQPDGQVQVKWTETVDHFGCFQIAFSANGEAGPFTVLRQLDDPAGDATPRQLTATVKLPAGVTCKDCVIQVRQLMINRYCKGSPMLDAGGGVENIANLGPTDVYYGCADIRVGDFDAGPSPDDGGSSGTTSSSGATSSSSSSGTSGEGPITTRVDGGEEGSLITDDNGDKNSAGCSTTAGTNGTTAIFGIAGAALGLTVFRRRRKR